MKKFATFILSIFAFPLFPCEGINPNGCPGGEPKGCPDIDPSQPIPDAPPAPVLINASCSKSDIVKPPPPTSPSTDGTDAGSQGSDSSTTGTGTAPTPAKPTTDKSYCVDFKNTTQEAATEACTTSFQGTLKPKASCTVKTATLGCTSTDADTGITITVWLTGSSWGANSNTTTNSLCTGSTPTTKT